MTRLPNAAPRTAALFTLMGLVGCRPTSSVEPSSRVDLSEFAVEFVRSMLAAFLL